MSAFQWLGWLGINCSVIDAFIEGLSVGRAPTGREQATLDLYEGSWKVLWSPTGDSFFRAVYPEAK